MNKMDSPGFDPGSSDFQSDAFTRLAYCPDVKNSHNGTRTHKIVILSHARMPIPPHGLKIQEVGFEPTRRSTARQGLNLVPVPFGYSCLKIIKKKLPTPKNME